MSDLFQSLRECLGGPKTSYDSHSQVPLPTLTRGQVQLQRVKQESVHLRMKFDMLLEQIKKLSAQGVSRTDPRIVGKGRSLQRLQLQLQSYELQESQLEDALHQESMSSIANETLLVLKGHAKATQKKRRDFETEIGVADDLVDTKNELQEHIETLMSMDSAGSNADPLNEFLDNVLEKEENELPVAPVPIAENVHCVDNVPELKDMLSPEKIINVPVAKGPLKENETMQKKLLTEKNKPGSLSTAAVM